MHCKSVSKYFSISQCKFKALRRGITEVTVEITVLRKPINNATVRGEVRKRGVETGKPLMDFQIDACAFQRNKNRNVIANLVYQFMGLEKWSNMNHTCPYNHDLLLKQYPFNGWTMGKLVPLPLGHYTVTTFWASYNMDGVQVDVYFELYEK
ncbi:uncharacterized protein LOC125777634 [Bactrocera dorsalis]|uniref:Uncharacterized protein LOC125777634 n=1 Tax=Bactrocera dorsalis TaxID=27457 RepID=A0ABM3JHH6_BACDO|nr:uncharacterized protein LOC125777634 [Bactrocera dorsalis]